MRKKTNIRNEYFIYVANKPRSKTVDLIGQYYIRKLRKVLNDIVTQGKLMESYELDDFIRMAGSYTLVTRKIFVDGELIESKQDQQPYLKGLLQSKEENFLHFELSKSLCYFLGKKGNLKKIKICTICKDFFIAKDVKRIRCYKKRCENFYHAAAMVKYRRKSAKNKNSTKDSK